MERRLVLLGGAAIVLAVVIGTVWGVADAGRIEAGEATTTTVFSEATSTTNALESTTSSASSPDSTTTTALPFTTTSRPASGDGAPAATAAPPPNRPPVIEDPGISSDGMKLTISPVISDPENDPVEVYFELDGDRFATSDGTSPVTTSLIPGQPPTGFVKASLIVIGVVDTAGNEVVETFDHVLRAISTVTIRDVAFSVGSASCFEEQSAQRINANIRLDGAIDEVVNPSQELRPDRSSVTLLDEITGDVVGKRPSQTIEILAGLNGLLDTYEGSHTASDEVLSTLFAANSCSGFLTYEIEIATR